MTRFTHSQRVCACSLATQWLVLHHIHLTTSSTAPVVSHSQFSGLAHVATTTQDCTQPTQMVCTVLVFKILKTQVLVPVSQTKSVMVMLPLSALMSTSHPAMIPLRMSEITRTTCNGHKTTNAQKVLFAFLTCSLKSTGIPSSSRTDGPRVRVNPHGFSPTVTRLVTACTLISSTVGTRRLSRPSSILVMLAPAVWISAQTFQVA